MDNNINKVIQDLVQLGTEAKACHQIWWTLERADFSWIPRKFIEFFEVIRFSNFNNMIISICAIYDDSSQAISFKKAKGYLKRQINHDDYNKFERRINELSNRMQPIKGIRNHYLAHRSSKMTITQIFDEYQTTPNEIENIILGTAEIINEIARSQSLVNVIFEGERASQATHSLLETLRKKYNNHHMK